MRMRKNVSFTVCFLLSFAAMPTERDAFSGENGIPPPDSFVLSTNDEASSYRRLDVYPSCFEYQPHMTFIPIGLLDSAGRPCAGMVARLYRHIPRSDIPPWAVFDEEKVNHALLTVHGPRNILGWEQPEDTPYPIRNNPLKPDGAPPWRRTLPGSPPDKSIYLAKAAPAFFSTDRCYAYGITLMRNHSDGQSLLLTVSAYGYSAAGLILLGDTLYMATVDLEVFGQHEAAEVDAVLKAWLEGIIKANPAPPRLLHSDLRHSRAAANPVFASPLRPPFAPSSNQ